MSRLVVTIDGVDRSALVRDETIVLVEAAEGGEIGQGGFNREDRSLVFVPALKDTTVEDARADSTLLFSGMTGQRGLGRGVERQGTGRTWDVALWDLNSLWDNPVLLGSTWNRPAETDYARMQALATEMGVTVGVMPNTNTVNMDATDYRGQLPRRVASDCGEAAQKNYFLYDYGAGTRMYYDKHTGSSLTSSLTLSTDSDDVDYATCWPLDLEPSLQLDPSDVYSEAWFKYEGGTVHLTDADLGLSTSSDYRERGAYLEDSTVKSSTKATNKLTKYLTAASTERKTFACEVELPVELCNEIRGGMRVHVKVPHLKTPDLDLSAFQYFRITRRELQLAPVQTGVSREWYRLRLEFASDIKFTSFHDSRPPGSTDDGDTSDTAVTLTLFQLAQEAGSGYFGPFAGAYDSISPAFAFGTISAAVDGILDRAPEGNISWPYTDCGVGTGGVAGLTTRAVWHRFTIDLSGGDIIGVRVTVLPFLVTGSGYTESPGGMLVGDSTVVVGIHTGTSSTAAEVSDSEDYAECGRVGDQGGEVFIPVSLLIDVTDGYNWIVLTPGWQISAGLFFCNTAANHPFGYGKTGHTSNNSQIVSAHAVSFSGTGRSPWLPATGDVDGSNKVFGLPLWGGDGMPEISVGVTALLPGEYTVDSTTKEATLLIAPADDLDGQVFYRARLT